ncbi:MAG: response regulator, partial [Alphaproteobacteria bacterium]
MVIQDIARTARPTRPERPRESAGPGAKTTLEVAVVNASRNEFAFIDRLLSAPNAIRFSLTHVAGFEAARALLAARHFDSALVDATLGNHSGVELIRQLGGPRCPTPFILLAERDDPAIEAAAARVGATDCLDKRHLSPALLKHVIWHARLQHGIENRLRESE